MADEQPNASLSALSARKLGDHVKLVSGGPTMVVEYLRDDGYTGCVWFCDDEVCRDAFPTVALRLAGVAGSTLSVIVGSGGAGGSAA